VLRVMIRIILPISKNICAPDKKTLKWRVGCVMAVKASISDFKITTSDKRKGEDHECQVGFGSGFRFGVGCDDWSANDFSFFIFFSGVAPWGILRREAFVKKDRTVFGFGFPCHCDWNFYWGVSRI